MQFSSFIFLFGVQRYKLHYKSRIPPTGIEIFSVNNADCPTKPALPDTAYNPCFFQQEHCEL
jgi:hypothetical protein